jgi:hypothetical protein
MGRRAAASRPPAITSRYPKNILQQNGVHSYLDSSLAAILKRSVLWAFVGGIIGVLLWGVVGGTLGLLYSPDGRLGPLLRLWPISVFWTGMWAVFVAVIAMPIYAVAIAVWLKLIELYPGLDSTTPRQLLASLLLAVPLIVIVTLSFAGWGGPFPLDWVEAVRILPIACISGWGAVYLPRRIVPALRGPLGVRM